MLSTNRHERQSVHPWYMRRPPLVSASLRETRFLCLERERRNPAAWTCNKSAVTTTPAAYPLRPIRYGTTSIPSIHHPTDQPTNNGLEMSKKKIRQIRHHHHHPHTHHTENQCKIPQLHQYLPDFSPSDTRPTSPHLSWIPPKKEPFLTDPSIREDRSLTISKSSEIQ